MMLLMAMMFHFNEKVTFNHNFYGKCAGRVLSVAQQWGGSINTKGIKLYTTYEVDTVCDSGFRGELTVDSQDLKGA